MSGSGGGGTQSRQGPETADRDQRLQTGTRDCRQGPETADRDQRLQTGTRDCRQGPETADRDQRRQTGTRDGRQGPETADRDQRRQTGTRDCRQGPETADRVFGKMASSGSVTLLLPPVKCVVVYRNGDPFYSGRRFVVNHRQVATMEVFLNDVTHCIQAPLAVRTLYTPRQGHRVRELHDLQNGAQYVAAGFESYLNTGLKKLPVPRGEGARARLLHRPNVSAKWRKYILLPCIIQLCTLDGVTVSSADELVSGQYYVAVGAERFKKLPYVQLLVPKASERVKSTGDKVGEMALPSIQRRPVKEESSIFYARSVKVRARNRAHPRPPPKSGPAQASVFKAVRRRREEVQGAEEVLEDKNTAVDLPVDQSVAETVEDEDLIGRNPPHSNSRDQTLTKATEGKMFSEKYPLPHPEHPDKVESSTEKDRNSPANTSSTICKEDDVNGSPMPDTEAPQVNTSLEHEMHSTADPSVHKKQGAALESCVSATETP
ncbi:unnamed protein product, partial [Coregonus sp. 'balchen']